MTELMAGRTEALGELLERMGHTQDAATAVAKALNDGPPRPDQRP
jgi:hypothetical protein